MQTHESLEQSKYLVGQEHGSAIICLFLNERIIHLNVQKVDLRSCEKAGKTIADRLQGTPSSCEL